MGQDINWGAGSGAADALNEILTQRKLEARQAFLDRLNAQNIQSEIAYRNENAADLRDQREQKAALLKQQAQDALAGTLSMGQKLDPTTAAKLDPSWVNQPSGPPSADANQGVPPSLAQVGDYDYQTFAGRPQERKEAAILKRQQDWLAANADKIPEPVKAQMQFDALSGRPMTIPAGDWSNASSSTVPFVWVDRNGNATVNGKPVDASKLPKGSIIREQPAPPAPSIQFVPNYSQDPDAPPGYILDKRTRQFVPITNPPPPAQPPGVAAPVINGRAVSFDEFNKANANVDSTDQPPRAMLTRPPAGANAGKPANVKVNNATWNNYYMLHGKLTAMTPDPKNQTYIKAKSDNDLAASRLVNEWQDPAATPDVKNEVLRAYRSQPNLTSDDILKASGNPNSPQARAAAEIWGTLTGK